MKILHNVALKLGCFFQPKLRWILARNSKWNFLKIWARRTFQGPQRGPHLAKRLLRTRKRFLLVCPKLANDLPDRKNIYSYTIIPVTISIPIFIILDLTKNFQHSASKRHRRRSLLDKRSKPLDQSLDLAHVHVYLPALSKNHPNCCH